MVHGGAVGKLEHPVVLGFRGFAGAPHVVGVLDVLGGVLVAWVVLGHQGGQDDLAVVLALHGLVVVGVQLVVLLGHDVAAGDAGPGEIGHIRVDLGGGQIALADLLGGAIAGEQPGVLLGAGYGIQRVGHVHGRDLNTVGGQVELVIGLVLHHADRGQLVEEVHARIDHLIGHGGSAVVGVHGHDAVPVIPGVGHIGIVLAVLIGVGGVALLTEQRVADPHAAVDGRRDLIGIQLAVAVGILPDALGQAEGGRNQVGMVLHEVIPLARGHVHPLGQAQLLAGDAGLGVVVDDHRLLAVLGDSLGGLQAVVVAIVPHAAGDVGLQKLHEARVAAEDGVVEVHDGLRLRLAGTRLGMGRVAGHLVGGDARHVVALAVVEHLGGHMGRTGVSSGIAGHLVLAAGRRVGHAVLAVGDLGGHDDVAVVAGRHGGAVGLGDAHRRVHHVGVVGLAGHFLEQLHEVALAHAQGVGVVQAAQVVGQVVSVVLLGLAREGERVVGLGLVQGDAVGGHVDVVVADLGGERGQRVGVAIDDVHGHAGALRGLGLLGLFGRLAAFVFAVLVVVVATLGHGGSRAKRDLAHGQVHMGATREVGLHVGKVGGLQRTQSIQVHIAHELLEQVHAVGVGHRALEPAGIVHADAGVQIGGLGGGVALGVGHGNLGQVGHVGAVAEALRLEPGAVVARGIVVFEAGSLQSLSGVIGSGAVGERHLVGQRVSVGHEEPLGHLEGLPCHGLVAGQAVVDVLVAVEAVDVLVLEHHAGDLAGLEGAEAAVEVLLVAAEVPIEGHLDVVVARGGGHDGLGRAVGLGHAGQHDLAVHGVLGIGNRAVSFHAVVVGILGRLVVPGQDVVARGVARGVRRGGNLGGDGLGVHDVVVALLLQGRRQTGHGLGLLAGGHRGGILHVAQHLHGVAGQVLAAELGAIMGLHVAGGQLIEQVAAGHGAVFAIGRGHPDAALVLVVDGARDGGRGGRLGVGGRRGALRGLGVVVVAEVDVLDPAVGGTVGVVVAVGIDRGPVPLLQDDALVGKTGLAGVLNAVVVGGLDAVEAVVGIAPDETGDALEQRHAKATVVVQAVDAPGHVVVAVGAGHVGGAGSSRVLPVVRVLGVGGPAAVGGRRVRVGHLQRHVVLVIGHEVAVVEVKVGVVRVARAVETGHLQLGGAVVAIPPTLVGDAHLVGVDELHVLGDGLAVLHVGGAHPLLGLQVVEGVGAALDGRSTLGGLGGDRGGHGARQAVVMLGAVAEAHGRVGVVGGPLIGGGPRGLAGQGVAVNRLVVADPAVVAVLVGAHDGVVALEGDLDALGHGVGAGAGIRVGGLAQQAVVVVVEPDAAGDGLHGGLNLAHVSAVHAGAAVNDFGGGAGGGLGPVVGHAVHGVHGLVGRHGHYGFRRGGTGRVRGDEALAQLAADAGQDDLAVVGANLLAGLVVGADDLDAASHAAHGHVRGVGIGQTVLPGSLAGSVHVVLVAAGEQPLVVGLVVVLGVLHVGQLDAIGGQVVLVVLAHVGRGQVGEVVQAELLVAVLLHRLALVLAGHRHLGHATGGGGEHAFHERAVGCREQVALGIDATVRGVGVHVLKRRHVVAVVHDGRERLGDLGAVHHLLVAGAHQRLGPGGLVGAVAVGGVAVQTELRVLEPVAILAVRVLVGRIVVPLGDEHGLVGQAGLSLVLDAVVGVGGIGALERVVPDAAGDVGTRHGHQARVAAALQTHRVGHVVEDLARGAGTVDTLVLVAVVLTGVVGHEHVAVGAPGGDGAIEVLLAHFDGAEVVAGADGVGVDVLAAVGAGALAVAGARVVGRLARGGEHAVAVDNVGLDVHAHMGLREAEARRHFGQHEAVAHDIEFVGVHGMIVLHGAVRTREGSAVGQPLARLVDAGVGAGLGSAVGGVSALGVHEARQAVEGVGAGRIGGRRQRAGVGAAREQAEAVHLHPGAHHGIGVLAIALDRLDLGTGRDDLAVGGHEVGRVALAGHGAGHVVPLGERQALVGQTALGTVQNAVEVVVLPHLAGNGGVTEQAEASVQRGLLTGHGEVEVDVHIGIVGRSVAAHLAGGLDAVLVLGDIGVGGIVLGGDGLRRQHDAAAQGGLVEGGHAVAHGGRGLGGVLVPAQRVVALGVDVGRIVGLGGNHLGVHRIGGAIDGPALKPAAVHLQARGRQAVHGHGGVLVVAEHLHRVAGEVLGGGMVEVGDLAQLTHGAHVGVAHGQVVEAVVAHLVGQRPHAAAGRIVGGRGQSEHHGLALGVLERLLVGRDRGAKGRTGVEVVAEVPVLDPLIGGRGGVVLPCLVGRSPEPLLQDDLLVLEAGLGGHGGRALGVLVIAGNRLAAGLVEAVVVGVLEHHAGDLARHRRAQAGIVEAAVGAQAEVVGEGLLRGDGPPGDIGDGAGEALAVAAGHLRRHLGDHGVALGRGGQGRGVAVGGVAVDGVLAGVARGGHDGVVRARRLLGHHVQQHVVLGRVAVGVGGHEVAVGVDEIGVDLGVVAGTVLGRADGALPEGNIDEAHPVAVDGDGSGHRNLGGHFLVKTRLGVVHRIGHRLRRGRVVHMARQVGEGVDAIGIGGLGALGVRGHAVLGEAHGRVLVVGIPVVGPRGIARPSGVVGHLEGTVGLLGRGDGVALEHYLTAALQLLAGEGLVGRGGRVISHRPVVEAVVILVVPDEAGDGLARRLDLAHVAGLDRLGAGDVHRGALSLAGDGHGLGLGIEDPVVGFHALAHALAGRQRHVGVGVRVGELALVVHSKIGGLLGQDDLTVVVAGRLQSGGAVHIGAIDRRDARGGRGIVGRIGLAAHAAGDDHAAGHAGAVGERRIGVGDDGLRVVHRGLHGGGHGAVRLGGIVVVAGEHPLVGGAVGRIRVLLAVQIGQLHTVARQVVLVVVGDVHRGQVLYEPLALVVGRHGQRAVHAIHRRQRRLVGGVAVVDDGLKSLAGGAAVLVGGVGVGAEGGVAHPLALAGDGIRRLGRGLPVPLGQVDGLARQAGLALVLHAVVAGGVVVGAVGGLDARVVPHAAREARARNLHETRLAAGLGEHRARHVVAHAVVDLFVLVGGRVGGRAVVVVAVGVAAAGGHDDVAVGAPQALLALGDLIAVVGAVLVVGVLIVLAEGRLAVERVVEVLLHHLDDAVAIGIRAEGVVVGALQRRASGGDGGQVAQRLVADVHAHMQARQREVGGHLGKRDAVRRHEQLV